MNTRRLSVAAVVVTYLQLIFGGIVRISGSGMGCGDHWPKCNGSWIPPFDQPTVMIEWTHRLLALLVVLTVGALAWSARRDVRAVGDDRARRVARSSTTGFALVIGVALLGMITVKLGNTALATVAHWTLAMTLLAVLLATAVRTGSLGGATAVSQGGTGRATRSLAAGAAMALATVVIGALVAKVPGAAAACPAFPHCGTPPAGIGYSGVRDIQIGHRVLAFLLFFHTIFVSSSIRRRSSESRVVARAAVIAASVIVVQVALGASMVLMVFPVALRVAHEAAGVAAWMTLFLAAYLAHSARRPT